MGRTFSAKQKRALYVVQDGKCAICGKALPSDWHADHVIPWSAGGETDVVNGQALCPECNLKKGDRMYTWRDWQERCFTDWVHKQQQDYLVSATPGSGKSAMALRIAQYAVNKSQVRRVVVVVPTEYLKYQWKDKAHEFGIELDPEGRSGLETSDYDGMVTTYQAVAMSTSELHRHGTRKKTLVVFDEIHHAGDGRWGQALEHAFSEAAYRVSLSGTPFRSDNAYIPFVSYEQLPSGVMESKPDYRYTYGQALGDNVLKSIDFIYIDGKPTWYHDGQDKESWLSAESKDPQEVSKRLKTAFTISDGRPSDWLETSLSKAASKLKELRSDVREDSAGIVFVENQYQAQQFEHNKRIHELLGEEPVVVYSDKPESKHLIDKFREGKSQWIVSVKQVSEGVDIPRLAVFVYATIEKTELIFRQRIARILRVQNRYPENIEAYGYIPADPDIVALARRIEEERDHVIDSDEYGERSNDDVFQRELISDFIPGQTLDVAVKGVISGSKVYEVPFETAERIASVTGVSVEDAIKVLHTYISSQDQSVTKQESAQQASKAVSDQVVDMKQWEDKKSRKLAKIVSENRGIQYGDAVKTINGQLWKRSGARKHDCTLSQLKHRQELLKEWITNGFDG